MHGQRVPLDAVVRFVNGRKVLTIMALDFDPATGSLMQHNQYYMMVPYWRFRKPLIYFYALMNLKDDELLHKAWELLGS